MTGIEARIGATDRDRGRRVTIAFRRRTAGHRFRSGVSASRALAARVRDAIAGAWRPGRVWADGCPESNTWLNYSDVCGPVAVAQQRILGLDSSARPSIGSVESDCGPGVIQEGKNDVSD